MANPVYSTRFVQLVGLDGTYTYTCRVGFVTVLRDLDAYYGGDLSLMNVYLIGAAGQTIWEWNPSVAEPSYASWRGRQVLYAGETFKLSTGDSVDITVSGYELVTP